MWIGLVCSRILSVAVISWVARNIRGRLFHTVTRSKIPSRVEETKESLREDIRDGRCCE